MGTSPTLSTWLRTSLVGAGDPPPLTLWLQHFLTATEKRTSDFPRSWTLSSKKAKFAHQGPAVPLSRLFPRPPALPSHTLPAHPHSSETLWICSFIHSPTRQRFTHHLHSVWHWDEHAETNPCLHGTDILGGEIAITKEHTRIHVVRRATGGTASSRLPGAAL